MLEWDGAGSPELAIKRGMTLEILDLLGQSVAQFIGGASSDVLIGVPSSTSPRDLLVWFRENVGQGTQSMVTLKAGLPQPAVDLGPLSVISATRGDLDLDGEQDLVLSSGLFSDLVVLFHSSSSNPVFSTDPLRSLVVSAGPGGYTGFNRAAPALADLDGDSDLDILYPIETDDEVWAIANTILDAALQKPVVMDVLGSFGPTELHLTLSLELPSGQTLPPSADRLEVVIWRQEGPGLAISSEAVSHQLVPVAAASSSWQYDLPVTLPGVGPSYTPIDYIQIRFVELNAAGTGYETAFPPFVGAFSIPYATLDWLEGLEGFGPTIVVGDGGGSSIGGLVPGGSVNPFQSGNIPN